MKTTNLIKAIFVTAAITAGAAQAQQAPAPSVGLPVCAASFMYIGLGNAKGSANQNNMFDYARQFVEAGKRYNPKSAYDAGAFVGVLTKEESTNGHSATIDRASRIAQGCLVYGRQYGVNIN